MKSIYTIEVLQDTPENPPKRYKVLADSDDDAIQLAFVLDGGAGDVPLDMTTAMSENSAKSLLELAKSYCQVVLKKFSVRDWFKEKGYTYTEKEYKWFRFQINNLDKKQAFIDYMDEFYWVIATRKMFVIEKEEITADLLEDLAKFEVTLEEAEYGPYGNKESGRE